MCLARSARKPGAKPRSHAEEVKQNVYHQVHSMSNSYWWNMVNDTFGNKIKRNTCALLIIISIIIILLK